MKNENNERLPSGKNSSGEGVSVEGLSDYALRRFFMPRIPPVDESLADADTLEILGLVRDKVGTVPNFIATMANSLPVVRGFLGLSQALSTGLLPAALRLKIALRVSEINKCHYCISAHTVFAGHTGLDDAQVLNARLGVAESEKEKAALLFTRKIVIHHGAVRAEDMKEIREAGYSDAEISEIVANVILNLFTNYFNMAAETDLDFPAAPHIVEESRDALN